MKLPLTSYAWAATVTTDLVNTSAEVRSAGEIFTDPAALASFLDERDVRPEALGDGSTPSDEDLGEVRTLRGQVRSILELESAVQTADHANALIQRAATGPILLRASDGSWSWHVATVPGASLGDELAVLAGTGLLGALHALGHHRFRHCASPTCEGMFVDTSRAGRRRYCMPQVCGNRVNVANHRSRRRTAR